MQSLGRAAFGGFRKQLTCPMQICQHIAHAMLYGAQPTAIWAHQHVRCIVKAATCKAVKALRSATPCSLCWWLDLWGSGCLLARLLDLLCSAVLCFAGSLKDVATAQINAPGSRCSIGPEEALLVLHGFALLPNAPEGLDLASELMKLRNGHHLGKRVAYADRRATCRQC